MNESVVLGLVVGCGVAVIGALVGHWLRLREMQAHWDEDERKRRSDRKRELYERELRTVADMADALVEGMETIYWSAYVDPTQDPAARVRPMKEAFVIQGKAAMASLSLQDEELTDGCNKLIDAYNNWRGLYDRASGMPQEGKEEEYQKSRGHVRLIGSQVQRRIREVLEQV